MKFFLSLDLGTKTGWAMAAQNPYGKVQIQSGVQSFIFNPRYEGGGMRFLKFTKWLDTMRQGCTVERLAFEEVMQRPASVAAGHVYGGFLGHLTSWCELHGIPYEGVPVGTVKKHLTGGGKATKEDMKRWIQARGHNIADDNEADALAILYWMLDHATPSPSDLRSAPDRQPARRVPVAPLRLPRRPSTR